MASVFAHSLIALTAGQALPLKDRQLITLAKGVICATLPDLDILAFNFGIPYTHPLGHRGFSHSILFALILSIILGSISLRNNVNRQTRRLLFIYFFFCTASHGLIDAFTNGGRGVGFFVPFTDQRFFFPWRPIQVSPLSPNDFFSAWGLEVLKSEALWVGIPCILFILICQLIHRHYGQAV